MKATYLHAAGAVTLTFGIAACIPSTTPPAPTPPPVVAPAPTPTPTPAPPPPPVVNEPEYQSYLDAPQTEGTWEYGSFPFGSQALFNTRDGATTFAINCIAADRRITFLRPVASSSARQMQVSAETVTRGLTAQPAPDGAAGVTVSLSPSDSLLDAIAITKGRFAVETDGMRTLYLPAWAEVSRVIEDCR
ncbi:MAG: hypothetical protein ACX930_00150 [Erythrobacter sp.]